MSLQNTTPLPNEFFEHIPILTHAELRVLLVVLRQTVGWIDMKTGQRKIKDKMSYEFIIKRTGLYRTILSSTIQTLIDKQLLQVSDLEENILYNAHQRRGRTLLFYQPLLVRNSDMPYSQIRTTHVRNAEHNKRNTIKKKFLQKENIEKINEMQQQLSEQKKMYLD